MYRSNNYPIQHFRQTVADAVPFHSYENCQFHRILRCIPCFSYVVPLVGWMEEEESRPTFTELTDTFKKFCQTPGRYLYIHVGVLHLLFFVLPEVSVARNSTGAPLAQMTSFFVLWATRLFVCKNDPHDRFVVTFHKLFWVGGLLFYSYFHSITDHTLAHPFSHHIKDGNKLVLIQPSTPIYLTFLKEVVDDFRVRMCTFVFLDFHQELMGLPIGRWRQQCVCYSTVAAPATTLIVPHDAEILFDDVLPTGHVHWNCNASSINQLDLFAFSCEQFVIEIVYLSTIDLHYRSVYLSCSIFKRV